MEIYSNWMNKECPKQIFNDFLETNLNSEKVINSLPHFRYQKNKIVLDFSADV